MRKLLSGFIFLAMCMCFMPFVAGPAQAGHHEITCWFPPAWSNRFDQALEITEALTLISGTTISPRVAKSYPEILDAFQSKDKCLFYGGSFVQAILSFRDLGIPLVQALDGREFYSGVMILPKGKDPEQILLESPQEIAFTIAATSGESSAKAATHGEASIGLHSHQEVAEAVDSGQALAGFVKNWWWEDHKNEYPGLTIYKVPGISAKRNPDNILTASTEIPKELRQEIIKAAESGKRVFGAMEMGPMDPTTLEFSLILMMKGRMDANTYSWN